MTAVLFCDYALGFLVPSVTRKVGLVSESILYGCVAQCDKWESYCSPNSPKPPYSIRRCRELPPTPRGYIRTSHAPATVEPMHPSKPKELVTRVVPVFPWKILQLSTPHPVRLRAVVHVGVVTALPFLF